MRFAIWCVLAALPLSACAVDTGEPDPVTDEEVGAAGAEITGPPQCPGSWQSAPTYSGLIGTYNRVTSLPAKSGEMSSLTISTQAPLDPVRDTGFYTRTITLGVPPLQSGKYVALKDNPAVGPMLSFGDATGSITYDAYFVLLQRNFLGKVSALCLTGSPSGPFMMSRVGL